MLEVAGQPFRDRSTPSLPASGDQVKFLAVVEVVSSDFITRRAAAPSCSQHVPGTDFDDDLIDRGPWRYVKLRVIHEPSYGCEEFRVRPGFARASPLDHSAMLMKRNSASSTSDLYLRARMNPGWPAMTRALSFQCRKNRSELVRRHSKRVYQCNQFIRRGFAERDLVAHVIRPSGFLLSEDQGDADPRE